MAKIATKYLEVDPWAVIEKGFHGDRSRVSEALFSLSNEYMGVRGYFEEGYSGQRLQGSYFNGIYEEESIAHPVVYVGFSQRACFLVNAVDWLYTRIDAAGERLDLNKASISDFVRRLDLRAGTLTRSFVWHTKRGRIRLTFLRFLSMVDAHIACQRISLQSIDFSGSVRLEMGLDFSIVHENRGCKNFWECEKKDYADGTIAILGKTLKTGLHVFSSSRIDSDPAIEPRKVTTTDKLISLVYSVSLRKNASHAFDRIAVNYSERRKNVDPPKVWNTGIALARMYSSATLDSALSKQRRYWKKVWENSDVILEGDDETQQGVRFCIFQLSQTYHGLDPSFNVGGKGLTGEGYDGHTYWDTETYILPFYMFNNPAAARNLIGYRYAHLPQALERAKEMHYDGACYPMATIDGTESGGSWQHGNLEVHVSAAIPYAIWHYVNVCNDRSLLYSQGIEILLNSCRYFATRGTWNTDTGTFGIYGVMGPDEFHMMVHNNCYTNVMVKKLLEFTIQTIREMREKAPAQLARAASKYGIDLAEADEWKRMAEGMYVPYDKETLLYEQHEGFFRLPHIDLDSIPVTDFPLYWHWDYCRIFRYDMLKQPDVLLLLFFFSHEYSMDAKRKNYEYYEKKCIHESSLSPSVHSILASELGMHEKAYNYMQHASRLDLDDYNRNSHEGIHMTSTAAAWLSIVYGYGGMRSDGEVLSFAPSLPGKWTSFAFKFQYRGSVFGMKIDTNNISMKVLKGSPISVDVYAKRYEVDAKGIELELPRDRKG
jgi:maltose phosphorylase